MKKIFLDDLPRWNKNSRYAGKINWKECVGNTVKFTYDDIEGTIKIVNYQYPIVKVEFDGKIYSYKTYILMRDGSLSKMLGKYKNEYLFEVNDTIETNTGLLVILEQTKVRKDNIRGYKYKCLIDGNIDTISEYKLKQGQGCSICGCNKVVKGINDISTSHPHLMGYFINEEEAYNISHGSEKELLMKCKDCGYKRKRIIKDLVRNGFACPKCSDGYSYPEKFTFNVLSQLGVNFIVQYNPEWIKPKRYDFYIPSMNMIIEAHGEQHYNNSFKNLSSRNLKTEKDNDKLKKENALINGITKYIALDCRKSELEYIKNSILHSDLIYMYDFSKVNWENSHEFASNTRVREASDIWNKGIHSTIEIGKIMNIHSGTVRRYLKTGRDLGWNNYDEYTASIRGGLKQRKKVICLNTMEIFECSKQVEDKYKVNRAYVNLVCNHRSKFININNTPFVFMFYEEYINDEIDVDDLLNKATDLLNKKLQKRPVCLNTNEIFETLKDASEKYKIAYQGIVSCCKGKSKFAGKHPKTKEKLKWMYKEDYDKLISNT